MIVLEKCNPKIILGDDFLSHYKALINCRNNTLWIESPNNMDQDDTSLKYARAVEDRIIPEFSLCLVKGYYEPTTDDKEILIENLSSLTSKYGLITTRSLLKNTRFPDIWLLNPSSKPIKIHRHMKIGIISEVDRMYKSDHRAVSSIDLNFDINPDLSSEERNQVLMLLYEYKEMFAAPDDYKGRTHLVRHKIKTNSDIPIRKNPYRVSLREREIINNQIDKMLKKGIISHSSSPWASPVILVKKKDGTFRFCVDYRNLNSITVKDQYPLPRIDDCFDSLHGSRYFTSLDLCSGYWQVEVEEQDREKTAFVTPDGLYHFNVLPFGLCNGPATFERLMDNILRTHKWKICLCYLDDVIVFSEDLPSHLTRLKTILGCLRKAGLTLNLSKCRFAYEELLLLGHVGSKEGITPDPEKIASIKDFPALKTIKNVRAFLGLCSYYRRFIKEFSKIAYPLQILTRKNQPFVWGKEQESSFLTLKEKLSSPEVLTHCDPNKPIGLHTDASDQGLGAVLIHKAETNYSTTEKECLAIIWAIGKFRPYLYGRKFIVYTDHHSLCWMAKAKKLSGRLARWSLELQAYDFTINYKSGKTHLDADGLSRCPIPDNIKILQINYNTEDYDAYIKKINNMIDQHPNSYGENFTKHNGKIYKNNPTPTGNPWLLVIPKTKQLELLEQMHDHPTSGHMGIKRTYSRIKDKYFWPSMFKTVEKYVSSCPECQFRKAPSQQPSGQLQPIPPASRPFERIGIDLLGRFPKSINGNRWIVVCTDYYSRHVETAALPRGTATEIADFFLKKIVLRHGAPKILISDRGSSFLSKLLTQVLKICNTIHKKTTSYHPQTNGQTERMNRTLTDMISMYIDEKHQNWDEILPFVTFAYNSSVQETTGYSPYFLIHGREPLTFLDSTFDWPEVPPKPGDFDDYISNLLTIVEESKKISMARTMARQDKSKHVYDKHRREVNFSPDDLVLIWTPIRKIGRADKLQKNYIGPFKIIRKTSPVNYEVKEVTGRGKKIVHVSRMKLYRTPDLRTSLFQGGDVIAEADGELGKQEPSLEMLMYLRPKLLRCKDRFLIASDCLIEQLIKADREDEEIEDVDIVQANLFGRSEGVLQKMEQLLAKPTVDRESIVSGGNEGKSNLHRLPKLKLPKFGGEAREWLQFWSAFQSVHDDDSISACVKFQYLQNCMIKGSVSEEIFSSFPNSAANYPLAISTLKERFGREDMLVEVYVRDLIAITLENAHGRNTISFSTVYVRLSSQLRALGSLGVTTDKCAAILYPMVESALPEDLFVAWERTRHHHKPGEDGKHKSSEVLLDKLMEFLKHEVEGSERMRLARQPFSSSYPSQFNRDKPPKPKTSVATAASLVVADGKSNNAYKCVFCDGKHLSEQCCKAMSMSLEERRKIIQEKQCCYSCLMPGHISKYCRNVVECVICSKKHWAILCPVLKGSQKSDGIEEKSKNILIDASVDKSNRVRCQDILLQTIMVKINGENKSKVVRAMLDSGSQNSYVLEQTATEVGLTMLGKKEVVHLLFGGVKSRPQQHKRYRIYISDVDSEYNCNFEVQDCSTICSAMPSAQPTEWMTELRSKGIDLDVYRSNTEIELLLGADVYAKLLTGKKIELESGTVALETKLGWTVSGKVLENVKTTKSQSSVLSCLVRDATIQDVRRLDVIGIMEPMKEKSKEELSVAALEHFNQTVKQNEDGRYSVNLPWIGEHPPLPNYKLISEKKLESTTALAGIKRDMKWSVFVAGKVKKIRQNSSITDWRHVPGKENPADIPSRGASISQLITTRWWEGPLPKDRVEWDTADFGDHHS
ncbi:K02A2.6-like [Cordylochernes scorpioides]|uniref:RNA-directed DNA polymerase n=1 Tax=Cordylochernes scorpioides TaxID=51811 RepID=A0ABY6KY65_9ARAC|nr:K02A2.6-like [Cordylochernes scorpioides]